MAESAGVLKTLVFFWISEKSVSRPRTIPGHGVRRRCDPSRSELAGRPVTEVNVLADQDVIAELARRIEKAYRLRRPQWADACSSARVWSVAAQTLMNAHERNGMVPADPELYVAVQSGRSTFTDPWVDLTAPAAVDYYRAKVRTIVHALRDELAGELRYALKRVAAGATVRDVLLSDTRKLSPLGKFIAAHATGRAAFAGRFESAAGRQHRSCPLYRYACESLLPPGVYPGLNAGQGDYPETAETRVARVELN
jgi:hypothetical protein